MNIYFTGTEVELDCTFKDKLGVLIDPSTVTGEIELPDETILTPTVTRISQGLYKMIYTTVQKGSHFYRFAATGSAIIAAEAEFFVETSF